MSGVLSEAQFRALRWIDENPHTKSEWIKNWSVLELSGESGSIRIPEGDVEALGPHITAGKGDRIFALSRAGRRALSGDDHA